MRTAAWLRNLNTREDYEAYVRERAAPRPVLGQGPAP